MKTIDDLKKVWEGNQNTPSTSQAYDEESLAKIFKSRVSKQAHLAMQYFWASFALQIIVYALLSHVIVKYWSDADMFWFSIGGVFLYVPFTIMLMKKFKRMAKIKLNGNSGASLHHYVSDHHTLLLSFYRFKKGYELILIPLSCAIGVFLTFKLYVAGGVLTSPVFAAILLILSLISCAIAIHSENKKNFRQPIHQLDEILAEFKNEE